MAEEKETVVGYLALSRALKRRGFSQSDRACKKAHENGRIEALSVDEKPGRKRPVITFDVDNVIAQWHENTDSTKQRKDQLSKSQVGSSVKQEKQTHKDVDPPATAKDGGLTSAGGSLVIQDDATLAEAQRVGGIGKARKILVELDQLSGSLIDRRETISLYGQVMTEVRKRINNWPKKEVGGMAYRLGVDEHDLLMELDQAMHKLLTELADVEFDPV